ncbi:MAG: hypothetical protein ACREA0_29805, partial [bacterium]
MAATIEQRAGDSTAIAKEHDLLTQYTCCYGRTRKADRRAHGIPMVPQHYRGSSFLFHHSELRLPNRSSTPQPGALSYVSTFRATRNAPEDQRVGSGISEVVREERRLC